ncbi:MAG: hypothetical protein IJU76_10840 [Desulfovibrionaceae bacterium]|nr:hypothetical protein [Desulfovibrionaceae bacterium]
MSQVGGATQASQVSDISKISERNPQLALAMLMMDIAKLNKENAMGMISEIEQQQAKKKAISDVLNQAREYKASDRNYTKQAGGEPYTSKEFNKAVEGMGFTVPDKAGDKEGNDKNWDKLIAQLQTKLDTVGSDIQTQMVKMQDLMGQYNSMMQGANSAISQANQVLQSVAKGG